jgi:hypothetical protein
MNDTLMLSVPATADQPLHDMRAVHDVASLRFDAVDSDGRLWMVVRIIPAPHSGSATIGASIDLDSGQMVDTATGDIIPPGAARGGTLEEGSWELMTPMSDSVTASRGQYSWTKPRETHARKLEAEDLYQPFAQGGVIFCRRDPAAQGAAQFESVHLIPGGWETAIRPAYEAFKQSSQLFTTASLPSHYAELLGMLHGDNSVVAVMAFRTLAENRKVDIASLRDALGQSEGYRQAAFVYLMLLQPGQIDEGALLSELTTVVDAASAPEGYRPIAIAIAAARLLHPILHMPQSLGPKVLTALRDRSTRLAADTAADPYLRRVFEIMGIPAN